MRSHQVEEQYIRVGTELSGDGLKWGRLGDFIALVRPDDMAHGAALLRQSFSGFDIGAECRRSHDRQTGDAAEHEQSHFQPP